MQTANYWEFRNTYNWDKLNRVGDLKQESANNPTAATWTAKASTTRTVDLTYRADSSLQSISRTQATTGTTPIVTTFAQTADGVKNEGRIASITHSGLNGLNTSYAYTYDDHGRVSTFTTLAGTRTYGYDTFDQVTGATGGSQTSEAYGYDTNGNRTGSGVTVSAFNRVTNDGTYTYLYDNEGNRTRRTKTSNGEYEVYVWDYRQRLTSVTLKNSAGTTQQTVVYEYDGLNRRIRRTVSNSAGTVTAKQRFLYDTNVLDGSTAEVVLVLDELASGLPYQQVDHRFMNGPAIDQVFADEGSGTGNQVLWYLSDAQNTVRDVAKYTNTTSGATAKIRNHLEYDSFGNVTSVDDPTTGGNPSDGDLPGLEGSGNEYSPQRSYTGREPDAATGLIYYRARWFDPKLGRFISEDPIGFAAGDANLSRYVGNSTPNAVDPNGLEFNPNRTNWHHLLPQEFAGELPADMSGYLNSAQNGWYLLEEDHAKVHSAVGTTEWNEDWRKWFASRGGKKPSLYDIIEQTEYMKRKHGLVNMDGSPIMGRSVKEVDGMPYEKGDKGSENHKKWRGKRGASPWNPSEAERARNIADAEARGADRRRGTTPDPKFNEDEARRIAKDIRNGLETAAREVAERAKEAARMLDALKSLGGGALKRGKKIGKIVVGCVPFVGVAGDAYGYSEDLESVGPGYATGNATANNTPIVEQAKGLLDIISAIVTGEDMFHPNGLGAIIGGPARDALRRSREVVEELPSTLDTLEGARDAGIPVYPERGSALDRFFDLIRGPFRNW